MAANIIRDPEITEPSAVWTYTISGSSTAWAR